MNQTAPKKAKANGGGKPAPWWRHVSLRTAPTWVFNSLLIISPGLVPLILYVVSESLMIRATVLNFNIGLSDADIMPGVKVAGAEARSRYVLASSLLLLTCMCALAIAASGRIAYDNCRIEGPLDPDAKRRLRITGLLAAILAAFVFWRAWADPTRLYEYVGLNVFPKMVEDYFAFWTGLGFKAAQILPWIFSLTSTVGILAGVALAVCGATFLAGFSTFESRAPTIAEVKTFAARRMARLKVLLIVASASFVAGILQLQAWQAWPLALLKPDSAVAKQYGLLTEGMTIYAGTRFALVLLAILVTTQFGLRVRATALFDRRQTALKGAETRETFLKEAGLDVTIPETLKSAFTIIAPIAAGPLATLLQSIGGSGR